MSANVIIFDGMYTANQIRSMNSARELVEAAVQDIKRASDNDGWKCPEARKLDTHLNNIYLRLSRLSQGIGRVELALGDGLKGFHELEERAARQAEGLSGDLRESHGIPASVRGQNEKTTLPVTEVPKQEGSWFENLIKGVAKKAIQVTGAVIGGIVGTVKGAVEGITRGLITDIKEGIVDKAVGIFEASSTIFVPPYDDTGDALLKIATNSVSLIGTVLGIGGEKALEGVSKITDGEKILGNVFGKASIGWDVGTATGTVIKDPEQLEAQLKEISGIITETITPFGLDQTILQGVDGLKNGAAKGGDVGYNIANAITNFLGL